MIKKFDNYVNESFDKEVLTNRLELIDNQLSDLKNFIKHEDFDNLKDIHIGKIINGLKLLHGELNKEGLINRVIENEKLEIDKNAFKILHDNLHKSKGKKKVIAGSDILSFINEIENQFKNFKSNSSFIRNKHNVHFNLHKLRDVSDIRNFDDKWSIFVKVCKQYNVDVMETK